MTEPHEHTAIEIAAQRTGLETHTVQHCVQVGLISGTMTDHDLSELRRIRRLIDLEVNLAGVEIIIRMRRRIIELQSEITRVRNEEL
jgi:MerR family transcriptional regulator/heat shock protein HspR